MSGLYECHRCKLDQDPERPPHDEQDCIAALRESLAEAEARAEQAERERDEAKRQADALEAEFVRYVESLSGALDDVKRLREALEAQQAEAERLRDTVADLVNQFAYEYDDPPRLTTGGLSALEGAFELLGWEDPHPVPDRGCDEPGCGRVATCGWPSDGGYRRTCGIHYRAALAPQPEGGQGE